MPLRRTAAALASGLALLLAPAAAARDPAAAPPATAAGSLEAAVEAWRSGAFREALEALDRALEREPGLRADPIVAGLLHGLLGNVDAAAAALEDSSASSPLAPLAPSAASLRERLRPGPLARAPQVFVGGGALVDTEPGLVGDLSPLRFARRLDSDGRVEVALRGRGRVLQGPRAALALGYEGILGLHFDETDSDVQTHAPWVSAGVLLGPARLGVRYDYAFTLLDGDDPFRHLHRVTPSLAVRETHWGVTRAAYQFHHQDSLERAIFPAAASPAFDRDGERHAVQLDQYFFLPRPFRWFSIGALGDFLRTDGAEWRYDAVGASFGSGYDFDHGIGLTWLYRYAHRRYRETSFFAAGGHRRDHRHELSFELGKSLGGAFRLVASGVFTWNDSDVGVYDYTRQVGGAYLTVAF